MIALPNGDLCVADRLYSRLQILSRDGEQKHTIGNYGRSTGQMVSCKGMASDGEFLYVSDYAKSRVQKLRLHDGALAASAGNYGTSKRAGSTTLMLNCPHGLALVEDRLYVADCMNHRVVVFSSALQFLFTFAKEGKARGELRYPRGIAYLGGGELVVASEGNHRLEVYTLQGEYIRSIGTGRGDGLGQFKGPTEVSVAHGRLYVCEKAGKRVQVFSPDGAALHVLPSPPNTELFGLCADGQRVYAADSEDHKLHVLAVHYGDEDQRR